MSLNKKTWNMKEIAKTDENIRFFGGNRGVDLKIVKKLKTSMLEHGVLSAITIMKKGKNFWVVDGQHRYTAAMDLDYSIPAIVISKTGKDAIKDMNTIQKSWSLGNFADFYAEMGEGEIQQSYVDLIETHEQASLNFSALLNIYGSTITKFKNGSFEIKDKEFADYVIKCVQDIKPFVEFADNARFIDAYARMVKHENYVHERMMQKLNIKHNILIDKKANPAGYGRMMQDIYNYKALANTLVMFANW